jgi:hypothetical protein
MTKSMIPTILTAALGLIMSGCASQYAKDLHAMPTSELVRMVNDQYEATVNAYRSMDPVVRAEIMREHYDSVHQHPAPSYSAIQPSSDHYFSTHDIIGNNGSVTGRVYNNGGSHYILDNNGNVTGQIYDNN